MMAGVSRAIFIACIRLFTDSPWILLGAAAFYKNRRVSKHHLSLSIAIIIIFDIASTIYLRIFHWGENYLLLDNLHYWLFYLMIFLLFMRCYQLILPQLIYVFCLIHTASVLINQIAFIIARMIYPPDVGISIATAPWYSFLMVSFSVLCFSPLYYFCRRTLSMAFEELEEGDMWRLCVIPVLFFFIFQFTMPIMYRYSYDSMLTLLLLLITVSGILSYVVNVRMLLASARVIRMQLEREVSQKLLELQKSNYEHIKKNIQATRAARHDLRFHLSVLSSFAQKQDMTALLEYLDEYIKSVPDHEFQLCANVVADAIASYYLEQIKQLGVACDCKLLLPVEVGISDAELCVVIGNLLENAVKALQGQEEGGWLYFRCQKQEQRIVITADNSVLQADEELKLGTGLQSVSAVAEKYNGHARFWMDDGVFKASVILHVL